MIGTLESIEELIKTGKADKARTALQAAEKTEDTRLDRLFLEGRLKESEYDRDGALEVYQEVLQEDAGHVDACFRAALLCDLSGDDDEALRLYEELAAADEVPINVLINLALLYEECGELHEAQNCLHNVLSSYPGNRRAIQLLKSVESSYTMVYDEKRLRDHESRSAIMDQPLTDFELSVRARNCLRQMNLRTLGDLLNTSEAELLAYKNFGETSLNEIKALLAQKSMRLGQILSPASLADLAIHGEAAPTGEAGEAGDAGGAAEAAQYWSRPISELQLSVRSRKCLQMLGVQTIGELSVYSESKLLATQNFGQTSLDEIKIQLGKFGISFSS